MTKPLSQLTGALRFFIRDHWKTSESLCLLYLTTLKRVPVKPATEIDLDNPVLVFSDYPFYIPLHRLLVFSWWYWIWFRTIGNSKINNLFLIFSPKSALFDIRYSFYRFSWMIFSCFLVNGRGIIIFVLGLV